MDIAIIGSGRMATAIGTRCVKCGHSLTVYDRQPEKAASLAETLQKQANGNPNVQAGLLGDALRGDVVILAVPYDAVAGVIAVYKDQLSGKIIVDICNPVNFTTFELLTPPGSSAAEEIEKLVPPDAHVVKAFNTTFAGTLEKGNINGIPLDVFIAGNHVDSKMKLMQMVTEAGLRPLDAGPLTRARGLEGFMLIHMTLQEQLGTKFLSGIKIIS